MLPKKYHAIVFIGLLVMLLLLGLHLLGIGYSGSTAAAKSAALARNSTQTSSSTNLVNTVLNQPAYRHPIVYDKLTGATNNQINEVLGAKPLGSDYPIDHYQQQLQLQLAQKQQQQQDPLRQDDFLFNLHNQQARPGGGFPPMGHPLSRHIPLGMVQMNHAHMMATTQPPSLLSMPMQPLPAGRQRQDVPLQTGQPSDSLPSASSLTNDTSGQQQAQQQAQQPVYYTPPIFAYNNFDNRAIGAELPAQLVAANNPFGYLPANAVASQRRGQQAPLMIPEAPISVDEYNARQARLRQQQQQLPADAAPSLGQEQPPGGQNLLADSQQQQRHRQQMLDQQLLFGNQPFPLEHANATPNLTNYYPDPALSARGQPAIRPPYASNQQPAPVANRIGPPANHRVAPESPLPPKAPFAKLPAIPNQNSRPSQALAQIQAEPNQQQLAELANQPPACARLQQEQAVLRAPEAVNSSQAISVQMCSEDPDYPTKEVMRALENYANERSIEQLMPQLLLQLHLSQGSQPGAAQQLTLDSLQANLNQVAPSRQPEQPLVAFDDNRALSRTSAPQAQSQNAPFPSGSYESLCKANVFMSQPRRAKNLLGQWKVLVNLPGHKYRGIAISQMVRVEECSRPGSECALQATSGGHRSAPVSQVAAKTRCLQHYENQRLVAWSHQQGLHLDIFRLPVACSCHIRK